MRAQNSLRWSDKKRGRLIVGLLGLALSIGWIAHAMTALPIGKPQEPGAAVFPLIAAGLLVLASLGLMWEQIRIAGVSEEGHLEFPREKDLYRLIGICACVAGYALLIPVFGYLLTSMLLSLAIVRQLKAGPWTSTAATAVAVSVGSYILFVLILGVPLPKGLLGV